MKDANVSLSVILAIRSLLSCECFCLRHRRSPRDFTRVRKLPFSCLMLFILQKSLKSLQLRLHEFFARLSLACAQCFTVSAFTQARAKLSHSAFIELNEAAILNTLSEAGALQARWRGHRLVAIDSSLIRLPDEDEIWARFGGQDPVNQHGACGGRVPMARLSVLYDVLNGLAYETRVEAALVGELQLARQHALGLKAGDLCLMDRGFAGCELFARLLRQGAQFVCRCQRRSFRAVMEMFARDVDGASRVVTLPAPAQALAEGLPARMKIRLVSLRLPTGELEVLATSLLDEAAFTIEDLRGLYRQRWGIETFYGVLKGRLDLENFSGRTVEAVLQDIHSCVFLTNLESVVTAPVAASMPVAGGKGRKNTLKINKAVSFHAIKSQMMELLAGETPVEETLAALERLFRANPVAARPERVVPRSPPTALRSLNHRKRVRKIAF
jgi:hypothetical protein